MHEAMGDQLADQPASLEEELRVEFGSKYVEPIAYVVVNEIEQIRKTYEPDKIRDLAAAITLPAEEIFDPQTDELVPSDKRPDFDMYNPLLCACLTPEEARKYLDEHAVFYGTEPQDLSLFASDAEGNYVFLIAGHRRKRAIELIMNEYEISSDKVDINVNLRRSISFEDALIAQIRENTYEKVPPEETAKNIEQLYEYLLKQDSSRPPTRKMISARTGLSVGVVSSALQFMRLPEQIRDKVESHKDIIPYSTFVRLEGLMRAYDDLYTARKGMGHEFSEDKGLWINNHLEIALNEIAKHKLSSESGLAYVRRKTGEIQDKVRNVQPEFEWAKSLNHLNSSQMRLNRARQLTGVQAVSALILAARDNPQILSDEQASALHDLLTRRAEDLAFSSADYQDGFGF